MVELQKNVKQAVADSRNAESNIAMIQEEETRVRVLDASEHDALPLWDGVTVKLCPYMTCCVLSLDKGRGGC